jgi:hypothetical protein
MATIDQGLLTVQILYIDDVTIFSYGDQLNNYYKIVILFAIYGS